MYLDRDVQALGVDVWNGSVSQLSGFRGTTGITYPLLRLASGILTSYACDREYFFVIDREGIIRYRSAGALYARYHKDEIIAVIESLLASPVAPTTWGGVKSLYRHQVAPSPLR